MKRTNFISMAIAAILLLSVALTGCNTNNSGSGGSFNWESLATREDQTPSQTPDQPPSQTPSQTPGQTPRSSLIQDILDYQPPETMQALTGADIAALADSVLTIHVFDPNNSIISQGSGFIAYDDRTLVTNYHVIENAYTVVAITENDIHYNITGAVYLNPETDIAVLRFETRTSLTPLPLADSALVQVGDEVYAIGSPQGLKNTLSNGIVSAFRDMNVANEIQFTAAISPGSSGGVLLNVYGEVVGIPYASFVSGQNLNLAIPVNELSGSVNAADELTFTYPDESQIPPVVNQPIDFRNWEFTQNEMDLIQRRLNEYGNPTAGNVDLYGIEIYYTEDGGLALIAFIRNGMNQLLTIRAFEPLTISTMDGRVIASANFPGNYGTILPSQSIIWGFNFDSNYVMINDADFSEYQISAGYRY